jgi:hypothetical protein
LITAPLDDYAAELLKSGMATAFAVALVGEHGPPAARTFGDADPGALWPIASIGKSFAAVIALQLADEGQLDLHAPVTTHLPWLPLRGATLHHLLTHTDARPPPGGCRAGTSRPTTTGLAARARPRRRAVGRVRRGRRLLVLQRGGPGALPARAVDRGDAAAAGLARGDEDGAAAARRGPLRIRTGHRRRRLRPRRRHARLRLAHARRRRAHNPWLPTFAIAAGEDGLALDVDRLDGSYREPQAPLGDGVFRVGEAEWSPERIRFDTVAGGRAQRAVRSGTPYYRSSTGSGS